MMLQYLIIDNTKQIEDADRLGLPIPKEVYAKRKIVVDINDILYARITRDNNIEINILDDFYTVIYDKDVWDLIVETINERERNAKNNLKSI
jgi:hypothetical protein